MDPEKEAKQRRFYSSTVPFHAAEEGLNLSLMTSSSPVRWIHAGILLVTTGVGLALELRRETQRSRQHMSNHVKDDRGSPNPGHPWPETITESPSILVILVSPAYPDLPRGRRSGICHHETPQKTANKALSDSTALHSSTAGTHPV